MFLFIMQGASGSGKTTLANKLAASMYKFGVVHSQAHSRNLALVISDMEHGVENIIVDNTNTQCWEAREYVKAGLKYGYTIVFIRCTGQYQNQHGVPEEKVQMMRDRMEELTVEKCLNALAPWERNKQ